MFICRFEVLFTCLGFAADCFEQRVMGELVTMRGASMSMVPPGASIQYGDDRQCLGDNRNYRAGSCSICIVVDAV